MKMDFLAHQLKATVGLRGRPHILPTKEVIKDALGLSSSSVSQEQHLLVSIEQSATTQEESSTSPVGEEQSFTAGIENLFLTQKESSTSPVGEELSLTASIEQSATTQEELSSPSVSKEGNTSPISRGKGRVQSSLTDSQQSNTKATRLKKRFQFDKNPKALTVTSKTGSNE